MTATINGIAMDWNLLKIFLAISETGTLSGAARQLEINHSTVFRRLNTLEQEIGGRLFERFGHGYELTPMGEELINVAGKINEGFDDVERYIVGKDFQPRGTVTVTAPNNIAYRFLPRLIKQFNRQYPDIRIEILASNIEVNMMSRQADIAIRATPSPPDNLVGRLLFKVKWSVYAGKRYKTREKLPAKNEQLDGYPLIGATGMMRDLPAFVWLEKHYPHQIQFRCDDLVAMSCMAEAGVGLAFLPDDQQRAEIQRLFTFKPGETSDIWILTHPDLRHVERIRLVMQHLSSGLKPLMR